MSREHQTSRRQRKPHANIMHDRGHFLSDEPSSSEQYTVARKKAINIFKRSVQGRQAPQPSREHPAIKRTKAYLEAHYTEEVTLQALAWEANLSPFHLTRLFRQTVGLSPHAYQTQLRLARARTLLEQGHDVGYVAAETGFFDQSHFTQQFKRHFFVTPASYRKHDFLESR